MKDFSQWLNWYGFSPVGVLIRYIRWIFCKKHLSQLLHWYGFSPVCHHMVSKVSILWEFLITLATLKWHLYFPSMYFYMSFKITYPLETHATIVTLICFLLYFCLQMAFKITFLWESLVALAAFIKFCTNVDTGMYLKITFLGQSYSNCCIGTVCDCVRFLHIMGPQMNYKITISWKSLVTLYK